jgi:hypothetical protein
VSNGEIIDWPLEGQITSGAWQLFAFNTGKFAHTLEIRFLTDLVGGAVSVGTALLPNEQLGGAVSGVPLPAPPALPPLPSVDLGPGRPAAPSVPVPSRSPRPPTLATVGFRSHR